MSFRPVQPGDFPAIVDLVNHFIQATHIHFGYAPTTAQAMLAAWQPIADKYPFLVALDDANQFLGFARAYRWREREGYAWTAETGIYLTASARGRGLGSALYSTLIDDCWARGFHTLVAGVALPNDASERLHLRSGFTPVGDFAQVGRKQDRWITVRWFQRVLRGDDHRPQ